MSDIQEVSACWDVERLVRCCTITGRDCTRPEHEKGEHGCDGCIVRDMYLREHDTALPWTLADADRVHRAGLDARGERP